MDPTTRTCVALLLGLLTAPPVAPPVLALLVGGLALLALPRRGVLGLRGLLLAAAVGASVRGSVPLGPVLSGPVRIEGVRVGAATGWVGDVRVARWAPQGQPSRVAQGRVRVRFRGAPPRPGRAVVLRGVAGPIPYALPGAPDPIRAAALSGIQTQVIAQQAVVVNPDPAPRSLDDPTGLLRAVALGDRTGVSRQDTAVLRLSGTAHLLAISGFHVGVVAAAVAGLVVAALRLGAALRPRGWPAGAALLCGVGAAWGYALVAGAPLSAQRAAGLLMLAGLGRAAGRIPQAVPLLALVAVGIAVVDPAALATPSLQLSFGAVLGLVVLGPRLSRALPTLPGPLRWAVASGVATVCSTLGTLPAAAWWFQQVAPLSPLANLIALPLMGFGIVPCAAVACWGPQWASGPADVAGSGLCVLLLRLLAPLAVPPLTPAVGALGALGLAAALAVGLRRPSLGALLGAAVLGIRPGPPCCGPRVTFLDVGQGDASLVEYPDGARWLVDGGPSRSGVLQWLRRRGIRHVDVVVSTHAEWDHHGGLLPVLRGLSVGEVWATDPSEALVEAAADVSIRPPPTALWPPEDGVERSANDASIVLGVGPVLLTGDIGSRSEAVLAPALPRSYPVLKVAHHGSRFSSSRALLAVVRPVIAVVSAGAGNRYGHPHAEVVAAFTDRGTLVLNTAEVGTVVVEERPGSIRVWTDRAPPAPAVRRE